MIKLSAILLFSIFILFLVITILFSRFSLSNKLLKTPLYSEGFVAFEQTTPVLTNVVIPQYSVASTSVVKLYDNIYFDTKNGNLIEVDGAAFQSDTLPSSINSIEGNLITSGNSLTSGNTITNSLSYPDMTGSSITGIYVITRDGNSNANPYVEKGEDTELCESLIPNLQCKYSSWIYNTKSRNTNLYQVFYMSWYLKTYIHIIQIDTPSSSKNIASYIFDGKKTPMVKNYDSEDTFTSSTISPIDTNTSNNSYVLNPGYDAKNNVYQVSKYVQFDLRNANLILYNSSDFTTSTVYNRTNSMINDCPYKRTNILHDISFNSWVVGDYEGNTVLYMTHTTYTLVVVLKLTYSGLYEYTNVVRFTQMGVDTSATCGYGVDTGTTKCPVNKPPQDNVGENRVPSSSVLSATNNNSISSTAASFNYNDYILKTQIVPAACGACTNCPYCSNTGTCSSCRNSSPTMNGNSIVSSSRVSSVQ
jgi:hypothetical protein